MRLAPIDAMSGAPLDFSASNDWSAAPLNYSGSNFTFGAKVMAAATDYDTTANVANWGFCELVRVLNRGAALLPGTLVIWDKDYNVVVAPVTGNTGRPIGVALTNFSAGTTTPQAGWVLVSGIAPVTFSVAATVGPVFGGTAGNATPTPAAGRQILGANTLLAGAAAFTRSGTWRSGQKRITVGRVSGIFVGQVVSGTGIAGGSTVAAIDPGGTDIILNNNTTAAGNGGTLTFTNTGFGIVQFERPHIQGQIT